MRSVIWKFLFFSFSFFFCQSIEYCVSQVCSYLKKKKNSRFGRIQAMSFIWNHWKWLTRYGVWFTILVLALLHLYALLGCLYFVIAFKSSVSSVKYFLVIDWYYLVDHPCSLICCCGIYLHFVIAFVNWSVISVVISLLFPDLYYLGLTSLC